MRTLLRATAAVAGLLLAGAVASPARADAVRDAQWQLGFLRMAEAHRIVQGESMTVAVLDTGVDVDHPDLAGAVLAGIDGWTPAKDGRSDGSDSKHGTGVATLIAGRGHGPGGTAGILGVAPKARILPVGVWPPGTTELRSDNVAYGIRWAVDQGAHVICIAGGGNADNEVIPAIRYAVDRGVPVVAAAGNRPQDPIIRYPAADLYAFAVSAVDRIGNFAAISVSGAGMDFAAPGVDIQVPEPGGGYHSASGTSTSAAFVAGTVALIRQRHPHLSVRQVYDRLKATAVDKGKPGVDNEYGWGVIDPVAALTATMPGEPPASRSPTTSATPPGPADRGDGGGSGAVIAVAAAGGALLVVAAVVGVQLAVRRRRGRRDPNTSPEESGAGPVQVPDPPAHNLPGHEHWRRPEPPP